MATSIRIKHKQTGLMKTGHYGFSWTYLLFGWFVPLFRGEVIVAALHIVFTVITFGLWQIIFCFIYNKHYMSRMLLEGWHLAGSEAENEVAKIALNIADD